MWEYLELIGFIDSTLFKFELDLDLVLVCDLVWKLNRGVPLNLISNANSCVGFNLN